MLGECTASSVRSMDGVAGSAAQRCKRLAMRFGMTGGQRPACKLEQQQSASKLKQQQVFSTPCKILPVWHHHVPRVKRFLFCSFLYSIETWHFPSPRPCASATSLFSSFVLYAFIFFWFLSMISVFFLGPTLVTEKEVWWMFDFEIRWTRILPPDFLCLNPTKQRGKIGSIPPKEPNFRYIPSKDPTVDIYHQKNEHYYSVGFRYLHRYFFFQYEVIVLPFYQKDSNAKQTDKKALGLSSTRGPLRRGRRPATSSMSAVPLPGGTGNHGSTASSAMLNALPIGKICPSERIPTARVGSYSPFLSKGTIVTVNLELSEMVDYKEVSFLMVYIYSVIIWWYISKV